MQPTLCSRCKTNVAVVFLTKLENGITTSEGLCLPCAREMGIQPMNDLIKKMGISDEDLDALTRDMTEALNNPQELMNLTSMEGDDTVDEEEGKTATFPFLNRLFSSMTPGEAPESPPSRPPREERRENGGVKRKFLENYCISLTQKAKENKLDRIVGRTSEIERVIQILNRRQKNNPCLIGEPGVGKTAIAEGLAQRIVEGAAPQKLLSKEVYLLDLTALVAGTQFRGQFESRMKGLIEEIRRLSNIILVIDEVHNLVGAGDAEGSMNAANILKPALSRGEIQVIGATTFAEYRKHIEKDAALERRFQTVTVAEPSITESEEIIMGIAHYYEQFHSVRIPRDVARQAVALSERYITDRYLPDKAIDLIDEACSDLNLKSRIIQQGDAVRKQLDAIRTEREPLMNPSSGDTGAYERLASLRSREIILLGQLEEIMKDGAPELSVENLATVIEQWTKIPASKIREQEFERLENLSARLKSRLIGQDEAVEAVAAAIKRNRVGISPKQKPVSFIFTGPTGVGKTELVKLLAQDLFDTPESLIRLDMSEFMEKHAVSRIIGSPPGYVGYDEAGQLTEKIRRRPYSVVLFDEIEKAHPDVLNVLLQILDDGHITDAHGRRINFENTIVIMTSNAGSGERSSGAVGFNQTLTEMGRERAMKALSDIMRPEFINRVDEVVAFRSLSKEDFAAIGRIMLGDLAGVLEKRGISLHYSDEALDYLVEQSFSLKFGARNLRRVIQKEIEDPLAAQMIRGYNHAPKIASVKLSPVLSETESTGGRIDIRLL